MNRPNANRRWPSQTQTAGFTLIEVMVTLALTMLMMYLFALIFQIAGNFVTRQKGIGENDQSARILTTVLQTDLQARTMQYVAPFHPEMPPLPQETLRQGYFYYSENNPLDDTDDVLQFTVNLTQLQPSNPSVNGQLSGLATNLPLVWLPGVTYPANSYVRPGGSTPTSQPTGFIYKTTAGLTSGTTEPNWDTATLTVGTTVSDPGGGTWTTAASAVDQPDGDDGVMSYLSQPQVPAASAGIETVNPPNASPNNTGESQFAEVTYFLRHGNLIRRVLLIRNPYNLGTNTGAQPMDTAGINLIQGAYPPAGYNDTFWGDFDYAARINLGQTPGVQFLGPASSLVNTDITGTAALCIGRPDNRFGFDQIYNIPPGTAAGTQTYNGVPREFALPYNSSTNTITSTTPVFFGRYTDEETSNSNFVFPGGLPTVGTTTISPMSSSAVLGLDSTSYTMWLLQGNPPTANLSFAKGPRRGEDILLTNVVSFDVKLWDNNYSEVAAGFDVNRNGVIDTSAAFADVGHTASGDFAQANNAFPVYGPNIDTGYTVPPAGSNSWAAPADTYTNPSNGLTYNHNNVFDTWYRSFNFDNLSRTYDGDGADTNLFAPAPYHARLGKQWAANTRYNYLDEVDPRNTANGYVYQCTTVGGGTSATPPAGQVDPFHLDDVAGTANATLDGTVQWTPVAPVNVQAIQITVKYLDPTQNLLRQVTIVQSLLPYPNPNVP